MAKELTIKTTISKDTVEIPSVILDESNAIYANFKKGLDKYAPGVSSFFRSNSTIVKQLEELQNWMKVGDLYKVAFYKSYFRDCKNSKKLTDICTKIISKLDSLSGSIGTSENEKGKKASIVTKGIKGLFSKRSKDSDLNDLYDYFTGVKNTCHTIIDSNKATSELVILLNKFAMLTPSDLSSDKKDLSTDIDECKDSNELKGKLSEIKLDFLLSDKKILKDVDITSYADAISNFLNAAQATYNNYYAIQHKFKSLYDFKGENGNDIEDKNLKKIKESFKSSRNVAKFCRDDLETSYEVLDDMLTKISSKEWDKNIRTAAINLLKLNKKMLEAIKKSKNLELTVRNVGFDQKQDDTSYNTKIVELSEKMHYAFSHITSAISSTTNSGNNSGNLMSKKSSENPALALCGDFNSIQLIITSLLGYAQKSKIDNKLIEKTTNYINSMSDIENEYNNIKRTMEIYTNDLQCIAKELDSKDKSFYRTKLANYAKKAGTGLGVALSVAMFIRKLL